jgi:molybdopterin molybdotransferase
MSATLSFESARACVLREVHSLAAIEQVPLGDVDGRVLAEPIPADRDYPPFDRSARDGFAVRVGDLIDPEQTLCVVGEIRAGEIPSRALGVGEAIEIMTGAPMPGGADAVVMVEHTRRDGDRVVIDRGLIKRAPRPGDNFTARGTEARRGGVVLDRGRRLGFAEVALLAMVGRTCVPVFRQPRVAILPTGDEIVDVEASVPLPDGRGSEGRTVKQPFPDGRGSEGRTVKQPLPDGRGSEGHAPR